MAPHHARGSFDLRGPTYAPLLGVFRLFLLVLGVVRDSGAGGTQPTLGDYRYFRALAIDLLGRVPDRAELAEVERPDFNVESWIDAHLTGPSYAERIRRIYMDLLRLDLSPTVKVEPPPLMLHVAQIEGPNGPLAIYFRYGQRRVKPELDGQICFTESEIGLKVPVAGSQSGTSRPITQKLLDERTVVVYPWWLYADYRDPHPQDRLAPDWAQRHPGYDLFQSLFVGPDKQPITAIRVCREEAQTAETGRIYTTGRIVQKKDPLLPGRLTRLPMDTAYAKANSGKPVSCLSNTGFQSSVDCGCGVGLERCIPMAPNGFNLPVLAPLGVAQPFFASPRPASMWLQSWWGQGASAFLDKIFSDDRDVREILTSRGTAINGPLAQFYRFFAGATCCGEGTEFGYAAAEPLFEPSKVPSSLIPEDVANWTWVEDRGAHASGILTMPIFLVKYGSRRARAHVLYQAFTCRDFVASSVKLQPSTEQDLTKRPGCRSCHIKLEPMAAYFSRITESDWTYLPASRFPISNDRCNSDDPTKARGACKTYYDPAFTDASHSNLRGAYISPANAEAGPAGLAASIVGSPEFAPCVVRNVAQSLLGRALTADDEDWKTQLAKNFVDNGYRMRPLVREILTSPRYREASDAKAAK